MFAGGSALAGRSARSKRARSIRIASIVRVSAEVLGSQPRLPSHLATRHHHDGTAETRQARPPVTLVGGDADGVSSPEHDVVHVD